MRKRSPPGLRMDIAWPARLGRRVSEREHGRVRLLVEPEGKIGAAVRHRAKDLLDCRFQRGPDVLVDSGGACILELLAALFELRARSGAVWPVLSAEAQPVAIDG